jgi:hypothetical protein
MPDAHASGWQKLAAAVAKPRLAADAAPRGVEMTIMVDDQDGSLARLLDSIKRTAEIGHSFPVVVDPGDPDHEAKFGFDGDGAFRIFEIKIAGKPLKVTQ